jgi:hypothetical protein
VVTPLRELIWVAGARWAIEECFQTAKNETHTQATRIDPERLHRRAEVAVLSGLAGRRRLRPRQPGRRGWRCR